ncbi:MAG: twin-arginine translocation signal domain-containing protein, partial [Verrucomicrobiota bacterium]|nr:twin-arginine translocation signal domain-containing protein [Verrucomicrobiota bacterium]
MSSQEILSNSRVSNRREFLAASAAMGAAITLPSFNMRAAANKNSNLRIFHIGVGGIGGMQRGNLKKHSKVEFAFLCDVDSNTLNKIGQGLPKAKKYTDYREVFEKHVDEFDAVIVDTPDLHH